MKILTNRKFLFIAIWHISILLFSGFAHAEQLVQKNKIKPVKLLCDFKKTVPNFYILKNGIPKKIEEIGIENLVPIYNKFVGLKALETSSGEYLFGYFMSIHDVTEKIAPNPVGKAYVKRSEMLCVNVENIF